MLDQFPVGSMLPAWLQIARAYLLGGLGRLDQARSLLDAVAEPIRDLPEDSEYLPALVQAAGTVVAVGGHPLAGWLYAALVPHRHRFAVEGIGAYCHGSVERHLAALASVLGRDPAAHLEAARVANAKAGPGLVRLTSVRAVPGRAVFRRAGDVWEVGLDGRAAHVKDGKGMRDLALLLARPRRALAAHDLVGTTDSPREQGTGEVVDAQARAAYRRRLTELEQEVDDARDAADLARAERAAAERDALVQHLTAAYGLGGRARTSGGSAERARTAVTARIRDAIRRVEAVDAELGEHLRRSVQTGAFCSYDPTTELTWQL
jgi:hypothetical protein